MAAGCGGSGGGGRSITVYNAQVGPAISALASAFEKATGIAVKVRSSEEDILAGQIVNEGSHSPADVILTENSPALEDLQARGLLEPIAAGTLARVPGRYSSATGRWIGVSARVTVLIYDPELISEGELPRRIADLADPRYRGRFALAPGETDFQPVVTAFAARYGRTATLRWLAGIKRNAGQAIYPDSENISIRVNRGNLAFGVVDQWNWYRMRAEFGAGSMVARIAPFADGDPGYVVVVSGAGVLASSDHRADAQRFVRFLVGSTAQEILIRSGTFEYPLAFPALADRTLEIPFARLRPDPITPAQLGDGSTAVELLRAAGLL